MLSDRGVDRVGRSPQKGAAERVVSRTLTRLGLGEIPTRLGQDARDAIAAALTARVHALGASRTYGS
jgi:hypothetical protein